MLAGSAQYVRRASVRRIMIWAASSNVSWGEGHSPTGRGRGGCAAGGVARPSAGAVVPAVMAAPVRLRGRAVGTGAGVSVGHGE